jgi:hypothetical protein
VRCHDSECEQWYVEMAVPKGGVDGLRGAWWVCWMSGRRPRELGSVEDNDLVSRGRQGRFCAALLEVRLFHLCWSVPCLLLP